MDEYLVEKVVVEVDEDVLNDHIILWMAGEVEDQEGRGNTVDHFEAVVSESAISTKGDSFHLSAIF